MWPCAGTSRCVSQITITRQSRCLHTATIERPHGVCRAALPSSLASHDSRRFVGVVQFLHPECRCQKQPWTKTAVLCLGRRMSTETARPLPQRRRGAEEELVLLPRESSC